MSSATPLPPQKHLSPPLSYFPPPPIFSPATHKFPSPSLLINCVPLMLSRGSIPPLSACGCVRRRAAFHRCCLGRRAREREGQKRDLGCFPGLSACSQIRLLTRIHMKTAPLIPSATFCSCLVSSFLFPLLLQCVGVGQAECGRKGARLGKSVTNCQPSPSFSFNFFSFFTSVM